MAGEGSFPHRISCTSPESVDTAPDRYEGDPAAVARAPPTPVILNFEFEICTVKSDA